FLSLSHPALLMSCDHRRVRSRFSLLTRLPPRSTLFPYTTLFRSAGVGGQQGGPVPFGRRTIKRVRRCCDDVRFREWVAGRNEWLDRKSTRLNSSHVSISYAVFCLKKKIHECRV